MLFRSNDTATTEIYTVMNTLSLHDALPIWKALNYSPREGGFVVDLDKRRLEGAPSFAATDTTVWDDPAYSRRVNDYYGSVMA